MFCGRDVKKTFVHDPYNSALHFPGCGLEPSACTYLSCCSDGIANDITSSTCSNSTLNMTLFDPVSFSNITYESACLPYFRSCFSTNSFHSYGQCCECDPGWTGFSCKIPICSHTCQHGVCTQPEKCVCDPGWSESDCSVPICTDCEHGACTDVDICRCFYGWTGLHCSVPVSVPACVHGIAVDMDVCKCADGYTGRICDIREE